MKLQVATALFLAWAMILVTMSGIVSAWDDPVNPAGETPTDDTISVEITDVSFKYDLGETMEVEISMKGTTEGEVDYCSFTMVTYYKNGTVDVSEWEDGPEETPKTSFMGYEMESHFKGTGDGGNDDWSSWSYYRYAKGPNPEYNETSEEDEMDKIEKVVVFVRAFGDESGTKWNQDSYDATDKVKSAVDGDDSPGFEIAVIVAAILVSAVIIIRRKRN